MLGRGQTEAHHILQLVLEVRILAERNGSDSVGLYAMAGPDSLHKRGGHGQEPSHGAGRPGGGDVRLGLGGRSSSECAR
jgi:hypothetical protein